MVGDAVSHNDPRKRPQLTGGQCLTAPFFIAFRHACHHRDKGHQPFLKNKFLEKSLAASVPWAAVASQEAAPLAIPKISNEALAEEDFFQQLKLKVADIFTGVSSEVKNVGRERVFCKGAIKTPPAALPQRSHPATL